MNEVYLGETWVIDGSVADAFGVAIPLYSGSVVKARLHDNTGLVLELTTPADGSITDDELGTYQFVVSPSAQEDAQIAAKMYRLEVKAFMADGRESVQNDTTLLVKPSAFKTFP